MAEGHLGGERIIALKPMTFMNESAKAVGEAVRFLKVPLDRVVVFHDELDIAPGRVRMKKGGGAGGHNGLRDLDAHVGKDYRRVRIGIGHPGHKDLVHAWVLNDFMKADREWLDKLLDVVAIEAPLLVEGRDGEFMNRCALALFPPRPKPPRKPETPPETEI